LRQDASDQPIGPFCAGLDMTLKIELWLWPLDVDSEARENLSRALSQDEQARAARFVFSRDRDRYIVGRGQLRLILANHAGTAPGEVRLDYGVHGKPLLADGPSFNLSHSRGWAALALCPKPGVDIGIDIEAHRPIEDGLAERFFSTAERAALQTLEPAERVAGFFRCWTRKEAFLKATGVGLSRPLDSFDVTLGPDEPARIVDRIDPGSKWSLTDLALGPWLSAALAVRTEDPVEVVLRAGSLPLPRSI
jgi:4'-phosphopantetheinyl transferase